MTDHKTARKEYASQAVEAELASKSPRPVFVNLSNHPSSLWTDNQIDAAKEYGEIIDMPFPDVDPLAMEDEIVELACEIFSQLPHDTLLTLHVMGEMTLTYAIVELCKSHNIRCVASTAERVSTDDGHGNKVSSFNFVKFRNYTER